MTARDDLHENFTNLLATHEGALRRVVATYAFSAADRDDLAQEITAELWRAFPRYAPDRPFATWLYRVALNVAISHVRRTTRRRDRPGADPDATERLPDPRSDSAEEPQLVLLRRLIDALDEFDRALLLLHLDARSYADIAEVLGISPSNVGTRLHRIRERLRALAHSTENRR